MTELRIVQGIYPMIMKFPYNKTYVETDVLPSNRTLVLKPDILAPVDNIMDVFSENVDNPIESPALSKLVKPGNKIGILVPDKTRKAFTKQVVEFLVDYLLTHSHKLANVTIFIGKGTHGFMNEKEVENLLGKTIMGNCSVIQPDPFNQENYKFVGTTTRGTRVFYDKRFLAMDKIILTGVINFHYFAGFGGGRKIQAVTMVRADTIQSNHKLSLSGERGGFHPKVLPGVLKGNPVHEDMMEITRFKIPTFLVNVVLNWEGNLAACFTGHFQHAHETGSRFVMKKKCVAIDEAADLVVASCGGYPFDTNYIQSHKTMDFASRVLKPGGTLVLLASCNEGLGREGFLDWFKTSKDYQSFRKTLLRNYQLNGHTALATFVKTSKYKVLMFTELPGNILNCMNIKKIGDLDKSLENILTRLPLNGKIIAIPDAHDLLPTLS